MTVIRAQELRNNTAEVLRSVGSGEEIEVLRDNRQVAKIIPVSCRRRWISAVEIGTELIGLDVDRAGLTDDLRDALIETTDDLPWGAQARAD
ncbi:type II toxin-antitoxin system Phd/YefM family antitoxin [Nonomuraea sp. NPDC050451]|uniref:type II toxin-antitoxin system Phd/YefM family antitoxin n=1 Tax=Nonomuraea sp. NPDC050451 TaxID=3364364 RepID=UPI00379FC92A